MLLELRGTLRGLVRAPGFSALLVLTLALGIGAATAIFSVADAVLLRPLPFAEPDRLVRVLGRNSFPDMLDWMDQTDSFEAFGGYNAWPVDMRLGEEPERQAAAIVTGELFPMLGVAPWRGRFLTEADNVEGGAAVAVASYDFWRNRLGGSDAALGSTVVLARRPFTIVGVLPEGFRLPGVDAGLFLPHRVVSPDTASARGVHFLVAIGRLGPGAGLEAAQADLDAVAARLEELYPDENTGRRFVIEPWKSQLAADARPAIILLLGFVGIVLLIACANAAGLLLARAARRQREIALRSALGAGAGRLVGAHLVESLLLALASGVLGAVVAAGLVRVFLALAPESLPRLHEIGIDPRVLAFALALSAATGLLFGLAPALSTSRVPLAGAVASASGRLTSPSPRLRSTLIVVEIALAAVLLLGAGLLLRSFHRLASMDPGFRSGGLLTMNFNLSLPEYRDIGKRKAFFETVLEAVESLPGVEGAAATTDLPFGGGSVPHNLALEGVSLPEGSEPEIYYRGISSDYFRLMGMELRMGRAFTPSDREGSLPVAVVNEAFVRQELGGDSPIGRRFRWARRDEVRWITIVGVVSDVRPGSLDRRDVAAVYVPFTQEQDWWRNWMSLVVRSSLPPDTLVPPIRAAVAEVSPAIPVADIAPMAALLSRSMADRRFHLALLGSFAVAALVLAAIGLYGLLSYLVAERRGEIGIRLALGAPRASVLADVLKRGVALTAVGLAMGLLLAFALQRWVASFLFGVRPEDPVTFAAIVVVLGAISAAASFVPAYRASRVDPLASIRYE